MALNPQSNLERGFTIVEVLIALAVAGLIMFLMLQAIPNLQRSSRNSQRRQDVSNVLQVLSRWELKNSGNLPAVGDPYLGPMRLAIYEPSSIQLTIVGDSSASSASEGPVTVTDAIHIYNYQRCDPDNLGESVKSGAGYHNVVALFAIETGNSYTSQCLNL